MNDNLIERTEKLLNGITPGEWRASLHDGITYDDGSSSFQCGIYPAQVKGLAPVLLTNNIDRRNAEFIAAAPQLVADLLAEVKRLEGDLQMVADFAGAATDVRDIVRQLRAQRCVVASLSAEVKRLRDVMDELTDVLFVPTDEIVDAVRRRLTPRVIETESELREFRIGTLIRDPRGRVWQRILGDEWVALGRLSAPDHVPLPACLLYAPEGGDL